MAVNYIEGKYQCLSTLKLSLTFLIISVSGRETGVGRDHFSPHATILTF